MAGPGRGVRGEDAGEDQAHGADRLRQGVAQGLGEAAVELDGFLDLKVGRGAGGRRRGGGGGGGGGRGRPAEARHGRLGLFAHARQRAGGQLTVEGRVDAADTLLQGRVRREEAVPETGGRAEEQVLGLGLGEAEVGGAVVLVFLLVSIAGRTSRRRGGGAARDFLEGAGETQRVARELDGGGVGEVLALPRDGGLDDAREEDAAEAEDNDHRAGDHHRDADLGAVAAAGSDADEQVAQLRQRQEAGDGADEAEVHPHVAVADVAELVGHDALQLIAGQEVERPAGHADDGVLGVVAGGEGIDAGVLEDVADGDGQAGGDGHLLDDVKQASLAGRGAAAGDRAAAEPERDRCAAGGQGADADEAADHDDQ